jgi:hypothetical protein
VGLIDKLKQGVGYPSSELLKSGEQTSATILEMHDTGVFIQKRPVMLFKLRVASTAGAGGYEVDHKQVVPQSMLGQLAPGVTVVAAVDPSDQERVELNWAQGVHRRGQLDVPWVDAAIVAMERKADQLDEAAASGDPLAAVAELDENAMRAVQASQAREAAKTMTAPAKVTILAVEDLGPVGQFTQMELRLRVTPQSGLPDFELPYKLVASDRIKALTVTGATFDADYDPANPTDVDIHVPPPEG